MSERSMIFSAHSVKAILAGQKVQTRRVVKRLPHHCDRCWFASTPHNLASLVDEQGAANIAGGIFGTDPYLRVPACDHGAEEWCGERLRCRQGGVGDRLWVREGWGYAVASDPSDRHIVHRATCDDCPPGWPARRGPYSEMVVWRSPIFMPRWASRLTLEITRVRLERVRSISDGDIAAEGFPGTAEAFADGWDALNRKRGYAWKTDPWCFAITFRVLEARAQRRAS